MSNVAPLNLLCSVGARQMYYRSNRFAFSNTYLQIKLIIKMVSMSSRILAFLPFDPRAIQQLRRLRSKFLRTFDPGGKWRQLTDGAYHVWQAFIGLSTLTVLLRSSGSDDILWPVVVAAKSLFDLVLVVRAGTDPLSLFGAGSRRRKWNVQLLDTIYHRIWIVVVTVRLQFYASLAIYDSDAIELELLLLLRKVCKSLLRVRVISAMLYIRVHIELSKPTCCMFWFIFE